MKAGRRRSASPKSVRISESPRTLVIIEVAAKATTRLDAATLGDAGYLQNRGVVCCALSLQKPGSIETRHVSRAFGVIETGRI